MPMRYVSLNSIIDMNPSSTLAVFGGSEANLRVGLGNPARRAQCQQSPYLNAELTRHTQLDGA